MKSRVHPKYKTKYRVTNWTEYDQALVRRGNITLWITPEAIKAWTAKPSGRREAPDHTTLSRRSKGLKVKLAAIQSKKPIHLIVDSTGLKVIKKTSGKLASVTGDAAYDTVAIYSQASSRGARVVVPPTRTASVSNRKPRSTPRDQTIQGVAKVARKRWKKESGYHRQGVVENAFFRYKSILGDKLHARGLAAQKVEAVIGCKILNRPLVLGRPRSVAIAR